LSPGPGVLRVFLSSLPPCHSSCFDSLPIAWSSVSLSSHINRFLFQFHSDSFPFFSMVVLCIHLDIYVQVAFLKTSIHSSSRLPSPCLRSFIYAVGNFFHFISLCCRQCILVFCHPFNHSQPGKLHPPSRTPPVANGRHHSCSRWWKRGGIGGTQERDMQRERRMCTKRIQIEESDKGYTKTGEHTSKESG